MFTEWTANYVECEGTHLRGVVKTCTDDGDEIVLGAAVALMPSWNSLMRDADNASADFKMLATALCGDGGGDHDDLLKLFDRAGLEYATRYILVDHIDMTVCHYSLRGPALCKLLVDLGEIVDSSSAVVFYSREFASEQAFEIKYSKEGYWAWVEYFSPGKVRDTLAFSFAQVHKPAEIAAKMSYPEELLPPPPPPLSLAN